jgi:DNA-binding PadR family transcriptional regulator
MSNAIACPCEGGTLDRLIQPAILVVLAEGPLHGYRLTERIGALPGFAGNKPDVSGVYRFLKTMESKGLVVSSWDLAERGPARKAYQITSAGERCLQRWIKTLEQYREGIAVLLRTARKAAKKKRQPGGKVSLPT